MTLKAARRALDEVADRLPFHVDDVASANGAYLRWHASHQPEDLRVVEIWAYCYTRNYFLIKFLRDGAYGPNDLDSLVTKAFLRIRDHLDDVNDPERFASWVSVICRNVFRSFLRRRRERFTLTEGLMPTEAASYGEYDRRLARRAVEEAIGGLPAFLREVVRLRYLEGLSYNDISAATGTPAATARAYVHRAAERLRASPALRLLFDELTS